MERLGWSYVSPRTTGIYQLWERLVEAAKTDRPLTAAKWLHDVQAVVQLPGGGAHVLDVRSGSARDHTILNELCTFMTARSYWEGEVLIGAYVIESSRGRPSNAWFDWLERLQLFDGYTEQQRMDFAIQQMKKAHAWHQR